jgi:hypothetical protein
MCALLSGLLHCLTADRTTPTLVADLRAGTASRRKLHPDEIRAVDCYGVTRQKRAYQFVSRPSPCAWVQVRLTTKLTTDRLDVLGRPWTMCRQKPRIQGGVGRPWTILDSAPRAPHPQGAGALPLPPAPRILNLSRRQRHGVPPGMIGPHGLGCSRRSTSRRMSRRRTSRCGEQCRHTQSGTPPVAPRRSHQRRLDLGSSSALDGVRQGSNGVSNRSRSTSAYPWLLMWSMIRNSASGSCKLLHSCPVRMLSA